MTAAASRYAALDRLPRGLYQPVVTGVHGALAARAEAVAALWDALLGGSLPPADALPWPEAPHRDALLEALAAEGLPAVCRGDRGVTEVLLLDLLALADDLDRARDHFTLLGAQLRGLGEAEVDAAPGASGACGGDDALAGGMPRWRRPRIDDATRSKMRAEAGRLMAQFAGARVRAMLADRWRGGWPCGASSPACSTRSGRRSLGAGASASARSPSTAGTRCSACASWSTRCPRCAPGSRASGGCAPSTTPRSRASWSGRWARSAGRGR